MEEGVDEAEALVEVEGALCKELGPGRPAKVETAPLGRNNGGGRSVGMVSQISVSSQRACIHARAHRQLSRNYISHVRL